MDRLLLLVPTTSYRIGDFLAAAGRMDVEVAVGSDAADVLADLGGGRTLKVDFKDPEGAIEAITDFASNHPLRAILGVDEETGVIAAAAAERLGIAQNSPDAVRAAGDKRRFRERLQGAGLPGPRFFTLSATDDPAFAAARADYPCVLKPLSLSASRGVIRADDELDFIGAAVRIRALLAELGSTGDILVEDYLPGGEVALEGLMEGGRLTCLALFDKPDPLEGPFFAETIYVTPSRLAPETQAAIREMAERAAQAIGLEEGPIHAELRVHPTAPLANEAGPWMVELAARSIGGLCARALRFEGGAALEELILKNALGLSVESREREAQASGVMMIPIPMAGILKSVAGRGAALAVPGVTEITLSIPVGRPVVPLPEGDKYLGFIFAKAATPEAVEAALRAAHAELRINIEAV